MNEQNHDWITPHRVRFARQIAARDRSFPQVAGASVWRFDAEDYARQAAG